jgi:hypothetical protein
MIDLFRVYNRARTRIVHTAAQPTASRPASTWASIHLSSFRARYSFHPSHPSPNRRSCSSRTSDNFTDTDEASGTERDRSQAGSKPSS